MILKAVRYHKNEGSDKLLDQEKKDVLIIDNVERVFQMYDSIGSKFIELTKNDGQTETLQITQVAKEEDCCTTDVRFNLVFLMNDKGETIERLI